MKTEFSTSWNSSEQPRKQKKFRIKAPLHLRHKLVSANLSKELREKYKRRSFPVRKNDKVKVMVGKFKGKDGKITDVDLRTLRVSIEGIQIQKKDGTKINVYIQPSNLQIQELNLEDKERLQAVNKEKQNAHKKK